MRAEGRRLFPLWIHFSTLLSFLDSTRHKSNHQFLFSLFVIFSTVNFDKLSLVYWMNSGLLEDIARGGYGLWREKWRRLPTPTRAGDSPPGRENTRHIIGRK